MKPAVDLKHLSAIGGHEDPELREIIEEFIAELDPILAQARAHAGTADPQAAGLRDLAHRLRGLAGSFGFKPLAELAALRDCEAPTGEAGDWVAELEAQIVRAREAWAELAA